MAATGVPTALALFCPREKATHLFVNIDGGITYRCSGCEWSYTLSTQAPTGSATNTVTPGVTTAITVASGGASFTAGMLLLYDTGANAEVVTVTTTGTATNIPIAGGFTKAHTATTFGQLLNSPSFPVADVVPANPGWGF